MHVCQSFSRVTFDPAANGTLHACIGLRCYGVRADDLQGFSDCWRGWEGWVAFVWQWHNV